ncbi:Phosphoribosylglycinamide synthetase, ATP-grasp (A) domain protein [Kalmanozyma brasiliensis GHG001]|uniref:Phosphoribosylformylglycinamidine cyclo-ligase n=1 Tax=Kalmanozyma brasiliensis (strain GHG001) TaxID=1365824 RepID=V5EUC1_KALBG|nr:Phosphoribosylglycinamide synthetase, ATP-grasp (A) domain protein [Kalmanozyma brasiliensis GHG001]EST06738.1 Phosphoribosylglycinamide synthetase, ATP-grasp (A) domain protein [Kalmanozyma brasiliensis GHG001]
MASSSLNTTLESMIPSPAPLRVLILGSGGREHAIANHFLRSPRVEHVFCAPGNGGTATLDSRCTNLDSPKASGDFTEITTWAVQNGINLCFPGPEQPLVDGVELAFRKVGIPVFGPSPVAAQMEGSKTFAKAFMDKYNIPTAAAQSFDASQVQECLEYIQKLGGAQQIVLKASGLAAGKGVLLPESDEEARQGVEDILVKKVFGDAGSSLLIEQRLLGPELSVLAFSDGYTITALPGCQDHKRIGEGDTGPNTGGMGAYSPAPEGLVDDLPARIRKEVLVPTIDGMRSEGFPFVGMLFVGLMLTADGPKVLEYNVRFGDPETEAVLELLDESQTSLADIILACVERRLDQVKPVVRNQHAVSIVLASQGYPGKYPTGVPITIGAVPQNVTVYHAGTKLDGSGQLVTAGGRVIAVSAFGDTLQEAVELAYKGVDAVQFEGKTFRRDIAHRALKPAAGSSSNGLTYAAAGVDIEAGNSLVEAIKPLAKSTRRPGCDASLGGFGGTFDLKAINMRDPVLVSGTDGVGTKLRVALDMNKHDTVGIDLVAMSVNDLLVQGAAPLYFLDYFACSKLSVPVAASVIAGIAEGCRQSRCGLIGGETAEMPGMYEGDDYDLAGFAVGAVEREALLPLLDQLKAGDVLVGLRSSGLHSNGFSLVRKIIARSGLKYSSACPWSAEKDGSSPAATLGDALIEPTRIYVEALTPLFAEAQGLLALSHITGGGFTENIPRILSKGKGVEIDLASWKRPALFDWLQKIGGVAPEEMARTLNNGIGMVLIVEAQQQERIVELLTKAGEKPVVMGQVIDGEGVHYKNMDSWTV